jgi:4-amino-4-deoxychorismate lyase
MSEKYFETIKCEDFEVFNLEYHKKRVANSVGINIDLGEYIYPLTNSLYKCKVIYDQSGVLDVQYDKYKKRDIKTFKLIYNDQINYSKKYLNRECIDKLLLKKDDCDEIIIVKNGLVTDTSIANIAIFYDNRWITSKIPLLFGTTRARLIQEKKIFEQDITVSMLQSCEKIALMNAMIEFDELKNFKIYY